MSIQASRFRRDAEACLGLILNGDTKRRNQIMREIARLIADNRRAGLSEAGTPEHVILDTALTLLAAEIMERVEFAADQEAAS